MNFKRQLSKREGLRIFESLKVQLELARCTNFGKEKGIWRASWQ